MSNTVKDVFDGISLAIVAGVLMKVLTAIATLLSIGWYCVRFYEWYKNRKEV